MSKENNSHNSLCRSEARADVGTKICERSCSEFKPYFAVHKSNSWTYISSSFYLYPVAVSYKPHR